MFEPSGEWDPPTHCVALYDYEKINPNDISFEYVIASVANILLFQQSR